MDERRADAGDARLTPASPLGRFAWLAWSGHGVFGLGVVFVLTWGLLELGHGPSALHGDAYEDLLRARACTEDALCRTVGVNTSVAPIAQGALWVDVLAVLRGVGLSVDAIRSVTFALTASSIAIVFAVLRRRGAREVGWLTAGLLCVTYLVGGLLRVPWNPSLTPLPAAFLFLLCLKQADDARWWRAVPLGVALGLTLESHPVAALVVPGALVVAGLTAESRRAAWLMPAFTALVASGLYALISPGAALVNTAALLAAAPLSGIFAALAALTAAAAAVRPRFARATPRQRAIATAALLAGPVALAVTGRALVEAELGALGVRYFAPALPALAFLLAESVAPALRARPVRIGLTVVALVGALAIFVLRRREPEPTFAALDAVRAALEADGVSLDEAWVRVSGPGCVDVLGGMAALGMPISGPAGGASHGSLIVSLLPTEAVGADPRRGRWRTVRTPVGPVRLGELDTWVDRRRFSACVFSDDVAEPVCLERDLGDGIWALNESLHEGISRLADPSVEWRPPEVPHRRAATRIVYRLPIRVPPGSATRTIFLPPAAMGECSAARFTGAEGVRVVPQRRAGALVVESTAAWQRGVVTVEVDLPDCGALSLDVFPPCLSELASDDGPALRRLLGAP